MRLTERRLQTLRAIQTSWATSRRAPTCRELGSVLGVSHVTAYGHVQDLRRGAFLDDEKRLLPAAANAVAGVPVPAIVFLDLLALVAQQTRCEECSEEVYSIARNRKPGYAEWVLVHQSGMLHEHQPDPEPMRARRTPSKKRRRVGKGRT